MKTKSMCCQFICCSKTNAVLYVICIRRCEGAIVISSNDVLESVCYPLFLLSYTWFKVKMIVMSMLSGGGGFKAIGTAYWIVCFTIKQEKWPFVDVFLLAHSGGYIVCYSKSMNWGFVAFNIGSISLFAWYLHSYCFPQYPSILVICPDDTPCSVLHNFSSSKPICTWKGHVILETVPWLCEPWTTDHVAEAQTILHKGPSVLHNCTGHLYY